MASSSTTSNGTTYFRCCSSALQQIHQEGCCLPVDHSLLKQCRPTICPHVYILDIKDSYWPCRQPPWVGLWPWEQPWDPSPCPRASGLPEPSAMPLTSLRMWPSMPSLRHSCSQAHRVQAVVAQKNFPLLQVSGGLWPRTESHLSSPPLPEVRCHCMLKVSCFSIC